MDFLLPYKLGLQNGTRLFSAVCYNRPFRRVQSFSTWEKPPLREVGNQEIACSEVSQQSETAECKTTGRLGCKPLRISKNQKGHSPLGKPWWKLRKKAAPTREEEFRSLRNDDFPELKVKPQQKPLAIERPKGMDILFGIAPCSLALARSKRDFSRLFLKSSRSGQSPVLEEFAQLAKSRRIPLQLVHRKTLDALCKGGVHQGVCLEATPLHPIGWWESPSHEGEKAAAQDGSQLIWLALEGIQDPMNLGAVLRSAHFLGVDGIVMSQRNSCPLTPVVSKASSGAMEVLDVFSTDDLQSFLKEKARQGWEVLGTVGHMKPQDDIPVVRCSDFHWTRPTILLLGNEGYGLSPETRGVCQKMLTISPGRELPAGIESLNVSVAAGIILHAICSQKIKAT
ncbi:rRNA methyltransferase 1, mitochondrial [Tiliqua scincoides]|uniref:rRNA methyltransferase 1, mitochondrial n=1 Tax=Tiliqua scincoides TaxID=71010 RepID=UPI003462B887